MAYLAREIRQEVGITCEQRAYNDRGGDIVVDCRGLGARDDLKTLRGVRGERILIEAKDVRLTRPVRLLHPRIPFYIVPWPSNQFTVNLRHSDRKRRWRPGDFALGDRAVASCAYALLPELGEARIVSIDAGVRPSFPDNAPKVMVQDQANPRESNLAAPRSCLPILAQIVADYISRAPRRREFSLKITVNGEARVTKAKSLEELCHGLGSSEVKIATARNGDFVPARAREAVAFAYGNAIEVLSPRQGG